MVVLNLMSSMRPAVSFDSTVTMPLQYCTCVFSIPRIAVKNYS